MGTSAVFVDFMGNEHDTAEKCRRVHHVNYETRDNNGKLVEAWTEYHAGPMAATRPAGWRNGPEKYAKTQAEEAERLQREADRQAARELRELREFDEEGDELYPMEFAR